MLEKEAAYAGGVTADMRQDTVMSVADEAWPESTAR